MHRQSWQFRVLILFGAAILQGCGGRNDPNPVGAGLFSRGDLGGVVRLSPVTAVSRSSEYRGLSPTRNGFRTSLAVGSLNRIAMASLIRFYVPTDTILAASGGKEIRLISASVRLTRRADQAVGKGAVTVWTPRSAWDETSVFADTTTGVEQPVSFSPVQSASLTEEADTTVIALPTALVLERLRTTGRTAGTLDSLDIGLQGAPGDPFVAAWASTDAVEEGISRPRLTLTFLTSADTPQTMNFVAGQDTFYGVREGGGPDSGTLTVGTGFRYWTYLKFNLPDSIPSRATINSARLEMDVAQPGSFPAYIVMRVDRLSINTTTQDTLFNQGVDVEALAGESAFSAEIGPYIVQAWTTGQAPNDGLVLYPISSPDLLTWIVLSNPRLKITYSLPPGIE